MGSYLTIINNTTDTWHCRLGIDHHFFNLTDFIICIIAGALLTISSVTMAGPLVVTSATAGTFMTITGMGSAAFVAISDWTSIITNLVASGIYLGLGGASAIDYQLRKRGFIEIVSGTNHRFGKMPVALWQEGECIRTTKVNNNTLYVDTVLLRPIFSGATPNSNNEYDLQTYIQRNESMKRTVVSAVDPVTGEVHKRHLEQQEDEKRYIILPNGKVIDDKGLIINH